MEQKIELEIRLRELAAQSMLEARNEIDVLEVEKSLLTSDQRMNCYAGQLEQQRKQLSNPSLSTDSGRSSKTGNATNSLHRRRSRQRSDVVGASANGTGAGSTNGDTSSPSFSSLSNSQSPSKLSPVSGQSANESQPSFTSSTHHSRTGLRHSQSNTNNLNSIKRAKNKRREQMMQHITSQSNINCNMVVDNRASASVSEIRIPLMWRDVDHFKNRGDYKRFAVFCLLKIDSQIYDTQLITDVDRQVTDVTFDDLIVFNDIDHEYELTLEVYSCVYLEQFSFSSTPRKLKEKLTSSVSRAMGRRLATQTASASYTKELQAYDKSYRFALIASAILKLKDASNSVKTYDLVLLSPSAHHRHHQSTLNSSATLSRSYHQDLYHNPFSIGSPHVSMANLSTGTNTKDANKNTLPLFGHFCCKLFVRPDVFDKNIKSGYLKVATIMVPNDRSGKEKSHHHRRRRDELKDNSSSSNNNSDTDSAATSTGLKTALAASSKMATLSMSSAKVYWALLRNFTLQLWQMDEKRLESDLIRGELPRYDGSRKTEPFTIAINKYTRLLRVSNSSLTLDTDKGCFVIGMFNPPILNNHLALQQQTNDELSQWLRAIEQLIYDSHTWGHVLNHYPPHTKQPHQATR